MRKYFVTAAVLGAGFALGVLFVGVPIAVRAGIGGGGAVSTGDVNGDGAIDVSDAVFTLLYLFKGGQEPVACADSPEIVARVAALEDTNERIASALEDIAHPCRERSDRFWDNGDGTVTDTCTGLTWMKRTADVDGNGRPTDCADRFPWQAAVDYCETLDLAGSTEWRLPTFNELEGLIRVSGYGTGNIGVDPAIDPVFGVARALHWTSTIGSIERTQAWTVNFGTIAGALLQHPQSKVPGGTDPCPESCFVLAVRGP